VVLYQEQVVQVAMAVAGYTAGQADQLRRNLNRRRGAELAEQDWPEFLRRARERGIPDEAARAAFQSILGFAAYGFPKSHAVAFGLLAYESTWLRHYYPAEFYAALFNNQPMGFYSTEVIAGDARRHGVDIVRPDINLSQVGCSVEDGPSPYPLPVRGEGEKEKSSGASPPDPRWDEEFGEPVPPPSRGSEWSAEPTSDSAASERARERGAVLSPPPSRERARERGPVLLPPPSRVRLGLSQAKSVGVAHAVEIVAEREARGPFRGVADCVERLSLPPEAIENLILAGAFDGTGWSGAADGGRGQANRRELLWELGLLRSRYAEAGAAMAGALGSERQPLLPLGVEQDMVPLPAMTAWEAVATEYETLGLSPAYQAMALLRPALIAAEAREAVPGRAPLRTSAEVESLAEGTPVRLAGLVTCRQRPSTAKGVVFVSLEDELGLANVVVYEKLFDRQRTLLVTQPFLIVRGRVQRQGQVVHIIADEFERANVQGERLVNISRDFH
jgi:error-prone DNA polymerase